jgi:hypothetical protein
MNNKRKNLLSSLGIIKISERTIRRRFVDPFCEQRDEHCFRRAGSYGCGPHLPVRCGLLLVLELKVEWGGMKLHFVTTFLVSRGTPYVCATVG